MENTNKKRENKPSRQPIKVLQRDLKCELVMGVVIKRSQIKYPGETVEKYDT